MLKNGFRGNTNRIVRIKNEALHKAVLSLARRVDVPYQDAFEMIIDRLYEVQFMASSLLIASEIEIERQ